MLVHKSIYNYTAGYAAATPPGAPLPTRTCTLVMQKTIVGRFARVPRMCSVPNSSPRMQVTPGKVTPGKVTPDKATPAPHRRAFFVLPCCDVPGSCADGLRFGVPSIL